jgi:hypothetical protein
VQSGARPQFLITTWRARGKPRVATIKDAGVLSLMHAVGRPVIGDPRMRAEGSGSCLGVFALPSGHVVELYDGDAAGAADLARTGSGSEAQALPDKALERARIGYVFANLDAWLTHAQSVDR